MKAYMGFSKEGGPSEGACLIFAHNAREALKLARPFLDSWFNLGFTDSKVKLIKDAEYFFKTEANPKKLAKDEAHIITSPRVCKQCETWGDELDNNGLCSECADEQEEE